MAEEKRPNGVLVLDFDWSLINENSDTWIIKELCADLMLEMKQKRKDMVWTHLVDDMLCALHTKGHRREQLEAVLKRVPYFPEMKELCLEAQTAGFEPIIVSDANTVFIDVILQEMGLAGMFPAGSIHTNPAHWEGDRLRVRTLCPSDSPHCCQLCPPQMCKGDIIAELQSSRAGPFVYVGDGGGDYCPVTKLSSNDFVLARLDFPLHQRIGSGLPIQATVRTWQDGASALQHFRSITATTTNQRH